MARQIGGEVGALRTEIDIESLNRWLAQQSALQGHVETPVALESFAFGQSNPTMLVTDARGRKVVLRTKPPGELLSKTAHAVEREYRVLAAVSTYNASLDREEDKVPVPAVYVLCEDSAVIGRPFYVMEYLKGRIFSDIRMLQIDKKERAECWHSAMTTLAKFHSIDPKKVGLEGYGRFGGFYSRQIKSLSKVSQAQAATKDKTTGQEVGEIPEFAKLVDWYQKNQPEDETTIVHGDFKLDNLVFHPTEAKVIGILDWELSTIGHPLSDLANLLQPFSLPCSDPAMLTDPSVESAGLMTGLLGVDAEDLPIPTFDELMRWYGDAASRRIPIPNFAFCQSWAWFRLAVIAQGIAARVARGQASSASAESHARSFPACGMVAAQIQEEFDEQRAGQAKL